MKRRITLAIIYFVFAFILLMALLTSCRPVRIVQPSVVDRAKITIRDTTIVVQMPPVRVKDTIRVPIKEKINTEPSVIQTDLATSIAYIQNSDLHHELRQHEKEIEETIPEAIREEIRTVTEKEYIEVERDLTWFQRLWIRLGQVLGAALVLLVGFFLIRKRL